MGDRQVWAGDLWRLCRGRRCDPWWQVGAGLCVRPRSHVCVGSSVPQRAELRTCCGQWSRGAQGPPVGTEATAPPGEGSSLGCGCCRSGVSRTVGFPEGGRPCGSPQGCHGAWGQGCPRHVRSPPRLEHRGHVMEACGLHVARASWSGVPWTSNICDHGHNLCAMLTPQTRCL